MITNKDKEKILNFIGYNKIEANVYEYSPRFGNEQVYLTEIWIHKDNVLYYYHKDDKPYTYKIINDELTDFIPYYYDKDVFKNDFLFYKLMEYLHQNYCTVISKANIVLILDGNGNEFSSHGTDYYDNFLNAGLKYINSLKK